MLIATSVLKFCLGTNFVTPYTIHTPYIHHTDIWITIPWGGLKALKLIKDANWIYDVEYIKCAHFDVVLVPKTLFFSSSLVRSLRIFSRSDDPNFRKFGIQLIWGIRECPTGILFSQNLALQEKNPAIYPFICPFWQFFRLIKLFN